MNGLAIGFDFEPLLELLAMAALVGAVPLLAWQWRHRGDTAARRLRALTVLATFLTFDLILIGALTRLTDSGLGCPDWPGCYGSASPIGAKAEILAAQTAMPTGPVTHGKAWMEMLHRYMAGGVGFLLVVLAGLSWWVWWRGRRTGEATPSPWWATLSLAWVLVQGLFGAWTVTMKLFPAIVTLHLLLALGLLMLLAWQAESYAPKPLRWPAGLRRAVLAFTGLAIAQVALGGWVSTNYAVLACQDFPTCQGQWLPPTDFQHGFTLWRELGRGAHGDWLPFEALTAIHLAHRAGAMVVFAALLALAWALWRQDGQSGPGGQGAGGEGRRWARRLLAVGGWQLASGLSNVVLGWPLVAALAHTGGAAALLLMCAILLARLRAGRSSTVIEPAAQRAGLLTMGSK
ncbi:cytochrome c oxidase assembly protein subunit 15 [Mitsuaria sp. PDC51]|uniref:COX15/CtaA family protein n=1 Tax=unclassified Roseateles TaxID=2626991 RepID=UPI0008EDBF67|nr:MULTISPECIES: COX15/CtaA family protein [unclassified Roseateles]MBB3294975.1 cytochrome c oxidase assembly protein subunit 15 [Mitsuaria sp. BK041]MBB3364191.1 cytochrome c oxidase assembly protein subunit 15 [Mitsuaria sp. BK045]SFR88959.1 cytochrome c oxidase assembly protein subunit 15 [Mitsuaria sp. PDC51]